MKKNNTVYAEKYINLKFTPFTLNIATKDNNKKYLKNIPKFSDITRENCNNYIDNNMNGFALRVGVLVDDYYIILIDIDDKEDTKDTKNGMTKWNLLIQDKKIKTPTQKTGNNGLHYIFKVSEQVFNTLPSSITEININGIKYSIDFKGKNQFMLVEPSKYDNKFYKWTTKITTKIQILPQWLLDILLDHKTVSINNDKQIIYTNNSNKHIIYTDEDIDNLLDMLSLSRCNNYDEWIKVGMCLYNINKMYLLLWKKWSKKSNKYEKNICENKWKTFKKNTKLNIDSLLHWCCEDDKEKYNLFMRDMKMNNILNNKFPDIDLQLGSTYIVNKNFSYTNLNNDKCLIKGNAHGEPTMYIEMIKDLMTIKCKHSECFGKIYPCEHHIQLTKNEMNIIFNGDIHVNIDNSNSDIIDLDDFMKINLFETNELNELIYNGLNGKPEPYADIIYELNKDKYVYTDNEQWYIYENHRWKLLNGYNAKLRKLFRITLRTIYSTVKDYYVKQEGKDTKRIRQLKILISNFGSTQLADDIMKELKYVYMAKNNDFIEKLNTNRYLIGFNNGVYDLKNHIFRDGTQIDYISMTVGYDYIIEHTKHYQKLLNFLQDIQPNNDELNYLLTYIATALHGNSLELFTILTGSGRNGKSKFIQLLDKTFGDYYDTMKSQILTSQLKEGDAPSPALLSLNNKKIVIASETLNETKLNTGFIKFITGNDTVKHRLCHQNEMIKFTPNFITLLVCNDIPECDVCDIAFSKRLRCINFPTEFVDHKINKPHQKIKDVHINEYFDDWRGDLFMVLIDFYKRYEQNKALMEPTENILIWTNKYKEGTDIYLNFLNECTEQSDTHIKSVDLYACFKNWFITNNPNRIIPTNRTFSTGIKKHKNIGDVKINGKTTSGFKNLKIIN